MTASKQNLLALVGYLLLTIALTWPLALHFSDTLPAGGDGWQEMWGLWWIKKAIVDFHTNPYYTTYLYYPYGVSLYFHPIQPINGLLSIPLQLLGLNLPTIYNLLVWFSFVAAGYGMYLLVRHLTNMGSGAFLAGMIFAFCPYHFAHMLGQLNLMTIQWMPLYILALFKAWGCPSSVSEEQLLRAKSVDYIEAEVIAVSLQSLEREALPQSKHLLQLLWSFIAGVLLVVNAYTEWLYAALMMLFTFWYFIWQLTVGRIPSGERNLAKATTIYRGNTFWWVLIKLVIYACICLALLLPVVLPMFNEMQSTSYMNTTKWELSFFSSDATDIIVPNGFTLLWRWLLVDPLTEHYMLRYPAERVVFAGYGVLFFGLIAFYRAMKSRVLRGKILFWVWIAVGSWVLSLGPSLHIWGKERFGGVEIPLPYALLIDLPGLNVLRVPSRIMVLGILALAVLSGYALAGIASRIAKWKPGKCSTFGWRYRIVCVTSSILVLLEFAPTPYPLMTMGYDLPFYQARSSDASEYAILELPIQPVAIYMAYQTIHQKPIVGGYLSRQPPDMFMNNTPAIHYFLPSTSVETLFTINTRQDWLIQLRQAKIKYVVVHWWIVGGTERDELQTKLAQVFAGIPSEYSLAGDMTIYQLLP